MDETVSLRRTTYHDCYGEIADALPRVWAAGAKWTDSQKQWRERLVQGMEIWHAIFEKLQASPPRAIGDTIGC